MAKQWVMVRVTRQVHSALLDMKKAMESHASKGGLPGLDRSDRFGLSLDTVIAELVARDLAHRKRSNTKAAKPTKTAASDDTAVGTE